MKHLSDSTYKWFILILAALTNALVSAAPGMCLSVLFHEISADLDLNLIEVGVIWGIVALPSIVTTLIGGSLGDRFGPKRIIIIGSLLAGLTGALRGMAQDFYTLAAAVFFMGAVTPFIVMNNIKTCGLWFSRQQWGLANGVLSMGMALGFLIGSMTSATWLSPWLGGWRNVLFFYGAIAIMLSIPWIFIRATPAKTSAAGTAPQIGIRQAIFNIAQIRDIWLLSLTILGISGSIQGTLGYLPLYLRGLGWTEISADGALSAFHVASLIFVIPIALWADRFGSRKRVLLVLGAMTALGFGLLSVVDGMLVWGAVIIAGFVRDGFMAHFITRIVETKGVGPAYAGTAIGFVLISSGIGNLFSPSIGNSLATLSSSLPFVFWTALLIVGLIGLSLTSNIAKEIDIDIKSIVAEVL